MSMKCSHCRMPVPNDAKICPYCGKEPHPLIGCVNKLVMVLVVFSIFIALGIKIIERAKSSGIDFQGLESLLAIIIGLPVASYTILKRKRKKRERQRKKEQQIKQQLTNINSISEEITELSNLYTKGVLSKEEFEKAKQKILIDDK